MLLKKTFAKSNRSRYKSINFRDTHIKFHYYIERIKSFLKKQSKFGNSIRISDFLNTNVGDWTPILSLFFTTKQINSFIRNKKKKNFVFKNNINSVDDAIESLFFLSVMHHKKERDSHLSFK